MELSLKEMFLMAGPDSSPVRNGIQFGLRKSAPDEPFLWELELSSSLSAQCHRFRSIVVEIMLSIAKAFTTFSHARSSFSSSPPLHG